MQCKIHRVALGVLIAALALQPLGLVRAGAATSDDKLRPYEGLGTWVDIYDRHPWRHPVVAVKKMKRRGVKTLFLQTSNYQRKRFVYRRKVVGRFLDAAHKRNIRVVAWYVPSFVRVERDYKRVMAALNFRSRTGERFDSFAMDIEADEVGNVAVRNTRLIRLSKLVRERVGAGYALGAIVPDPIGSRFWPNFPYRSVARIYDVFVPMSYFTYRTHGYKGVLRHTRAGIKRIRRRSGDRKVPIHVIGGEADDAKRHEVKAFVRAVRRERTLGASLYDFAITRRVIWAPLRALTPRPRAPKQPIEPKRAGQRSGRRGRSRGAATRPEPAQLRLTIPALNRGLLVRRCVQAAGPPPCTLVSLRLSGEARAAAPSNL